MQQRQVDVVVVGAGTAGANVAGQFAARGRSVVLVDRRPADAAGAQWHNGVLPWQFERAGVEPPVPTELTTSGPPTIHFVDPEDRPVFTMTDPPIVRADMAALGRRLREVALEAGVEVLDRATGLDVDVDGDGRVRAVTVRRPEATSGPAAVRLTAALFVDASGRTGVLRRRSPALERWCPEVRGGELCSAADHQFRITDRDAALSHLDRHGARPGENVTALGPSGGFSTRMITVSEDLEQATVLVGCLADGRHGTSQRMLADVRAQHPWLGEVVHGGAGVIPLRRPFARFTAPGLALVGDAASQVFPAHGSGIGMGLMAGRILVEQTADASDPGAEATVWAYQHRFHREFGGTLAAFDAFRRMSTALGTRGVTRMIRAGLLDEQLTRTGLEQRWAVPSPTALPGTVAGMAKVPGVAAVMVPRLARAAQLRQVGGRPPATVDLEALVRWDRRMERLLGPLPA